MAAILWASPAVCPFLKSRAVRSDEANMRGPVNGGRVRPRCSKARGRTDGGTGRVRDDQIDELLDPAEKHRKGVTAPPNQAQIDLVYPKSEGDHREEREGDSVLFPCMRGGRLRESFPCLAALELRKLATATTCSIAATRAAPSFTRKGTS